MAKEMTREERLSLYLCSLEYSKLSQTVQKKVRSAFLDVLECVYSANLKDSRVSSSLKTASASQGVCRLWGTDRKASACDAAYYNAAVGAVSYRNSLIRSAGIHPIEICAASSVAVAEELGRSYEDVLVGIVCGVEVMTRLGIAVAKAGKNSALRASAICGAVGAAVSAARTMGLSASQLCTAMSLASHFSFGTNQWGPEGTGEDVFQAAFAAMAGVLCARLAMNGAEGARMPLTGKSGVFACYNAVDFADDLVSGLGSDELAIMSLEFKGIEGCIMTQSPSKVAADISEMEGFDWSRVEKVVIHLSRAAMNQPGCDSMVVTNDVQAKMNIRYICASVLSGVERGDIRWYPPYDKALLDAMSKIDLVEEPDFTAKFPKLIPGLIEVTMKDGSVIKGSCPDFGALSEQDSEKRFVSTYGRTHSSVETSQIVEYVINGNDLSVKVITDCLV